MSQSRSARKGLVAFLLPTLGAGCSPRQSTVPGPADAPGTCEERRAGLVAYVASLPPVPVVSPTEVQLVRSTLGRVPGAGPIAELSPTVVVLDGETVRVPGVDERVRRFGEWASHEFSGDQGPVEERAGAMSRGSARVLYVAAAPDLDVQTLRAFVAQVPDFVELRLLVRTPAPKPGPEQQGTTDAARESSMRLLFEADSRERKRIADEAYRSFSDCSPLTEALTSVAETDPKRRWPALRAALERALPGCDCQSLNAANLRLVVGAEQRAGAASLGWLPLSFLRDERCSATMPLRALEKLVRQIEAFDEEFSAGVDRDALRFGDVLENDRLRVYFCDPLPGEMLAAKARARATFFARLPGSDACDGWVFEPLALGTPMGTWRRTGSRPIAFHYWQATEELRVFGPVDPDSPSKPTDSRKWACEETFRLTGVDASSVQLDAGRWFFTEAACMHTRDELHATGCFVHAAGGGHP